MECKNKKCVALLDEVEALRKALTRIADKEHAEECEFYDERNAPPGALEDAICTCCQSCRDDVAEARTALSTQEGGAT